MALVNERARILANEEVGPNLYLMELAAPHIAASIEPGQFVHMKVPSMEAHILRRPFSVYARDAAAGTLEVLYQSVGFGTDHMTRIEPERAEHLSGAELIGPVGRGWQPPANARRALLVGGGVGAAPLFMLCESLISAGVRTDVVLGAQTEAALTCRGRYEALLDEPPRCATDDGSFGREGFCTSLVAEALAEAAEAGSRTTIWPCAAPSPYEDRGRHGRRGGRALRGVHGEAHGLRRGSMPVVRGGYGGRQAAGLRRRPRVRCAEGGMVDGR